MRVSGTRCWKQQNEQSKVGKIRCLEVWLGRSRLDQKGGWGSWRRCQSHSMC